MIKIMQDWSIAKGRVEKEISRKIDSNIYGSKYNKCVYTHIPKTAEQLIQLDKDTREAALKQNAYQELKEADDKKKRIEQKRRDREERRFEREQKSIKKRRLQNAYDSDQDKDAHLSDDFSYDEELDGPFDPLNPKFKSKLKLMEKHGRPSKQESKSVDFSANLPRLAKVKITTDLHPFHDIENQANR